MTGVVDSIQPLSAMEGQSEYIKTYDDHTIPHTQSTTIQVALAVMWLLSFLMWMFKPRLLRWKCPEPNQEVPDKLSNEMKNKSAGKSESGDKAHTMVNVEGDGDKTMHEKKEIEKAITKFKPPPNLEEVLKYVVIMGAIMYFFYICDYLKVRTFFFSRLL